MLSLQDSITTDPSLIKCAWDHPILKSFMENNHAWHTTDGRMGLFSLCLRLSPYMWVPVRHELFRQAQEILPSVFLKFTDNNKLAREAKLVFDELSARSLEWQIEAYQDGVLKSMDLKTYHMDNIDH